MAFKFPKRLEPQLKEPTWHRNNCKDASGILISQRCKNWVFRYMINSGELRKEKVEKTRKDIPRP